MTLSFHIQVHSLEIISSIILLTHFYNLLHFIIRHELDKVAIVTGSSRGIGEAIALEFAIAGYSIVINSSNQEELSISKQEIMRTAGSTVNILEFPGDISQEQGCIGIVSAIKIWQD